MHTPLTRQRRLASLLARVSDDSRGYRLGDRVQRPETISKRLIFASLWLPGDSVESFCARHPGWSTSTAKRLIFELRRAASLPQGVQMDPWAVVSAYLDRFGSGSGPRSDLA